MMTSSEEEANKLTWEEGIEAVKGWNNHMKDIGMYPQAKMIILVDCKLCGNEVNIKGLTNHVRLKHFDEYYEIVMNECVLTEVQE